MVRAEGLATHTGLAAQRIFIPGYGFRRPRHSVARFGVCDYPFTMPDDSGCQVPPV